jgi:hypothetical protein
METQKLNDLNTRREKIIQRIACLTPEQFEEFLSLYSQQETELSRHDRVLHQTSA